MANPSASKRHVLQRLGEVLRSGIEERDRIETEYRTARRTGQFDARRDVQAWRSKHSRWFKGCLATIEQLYEPTTATRLIYRLKNPELPLGSPDRENAEWVGLDKHFRAQIAILDALYDETESIDDTVFEFKPGAYGVSVNLKNLGTRSKGFVAHQFKRMRGKD